MIMTFLREVTLGGIGPSYVEQVSETLTYIGYIKPGIVVSDTDNEAAWCIKKIEQRGTLTKTTYAEGSTNFNLKWSQRGSYTYKFRK